MEPSSPNSHTSPNENIDDDYGSNPFKDTEAKSGEKGQGLPNPFVNFRTSEKSVKKLHDTKLQSLSGKSVVGQACKGQDQREASNPFEGPEPKAREKSQGSSNPFGNFRISKKQTRNQNEGELQNSPEKKSTFRRDSKDQAQKDVTNPFDKQETQAEKSQGLTNLFGNFRISKKSAKKSIDNVLRSSPEKSVTEKDKVQIQTEESNPFEDPESNVGETSQGPKNTFGNFRISKKSLNKPHEEEQQSTPEKGSPAGLGQIFKSNKKALKRQSLVEEINSPDKRESFGQLGVRLSKIYHKKHEHAEEANSTDKKESQGVSASLVNKLKTSMKAKKKIDFNEQEDNRTEESSQEDKVEVVEEDKLLSGEFL